MSGPVSHEMTLIHGYLETGAHGRWSFSPLDLISLPVQFRCMPSTRQIITSYAALQHWKCIPWLLNKDALMVYISHLEASDLMSADILPVLTLKTHSSNLVVSAGRCFHKCTVGYSGSQSLRPLVKVLLFYSLFLFLHTQKWQWRHLLC